jgi:hypothetical protein
MSEQHLLSSWNAAMIAADAAQLSPEAKDLLIQLIRLRAAAAREHLSQLEAKEDGMPDDLLSGPLGKAKEASMLIVRTLAEAERLVGGGSSGSASPRLNSAAKRSRCGFAPPQPDLEHDP